ncbi:MAG: helix-turn-helix transcriptional regulator [bacterium]
MSDESREEREYGWFRANLDRLVMASRHSLDDVAYLARVNRTTLQRLRSDTERMPNLRTVIRLAEALGCETYELLLPPDGAKRGGSSSG